MVRHGGRAEETESFWFWRSFEVWDARGVSVRVAIDRSASMMPNCWRFRSMRSFVANCLSKFRPRSVATCLRWPARGVGSPLSSASFWTRLWISFCGAGAVEACGRWSSPEDPPRRSSARSRLACLRGGRCLSRDITAEP